jgi:indole-3-glycerol phosphate synthase
VSILKTILDRKRKEIEQARRSVPFERLKDRARDAASTRPFLRALQSDGIGVIAEVKKASPSRGILVRDFDHVRLAKECERGGARALSVLTDQYFFKGEHRFIREIKQAVALPVLRKDFVIDEYQVFESRDIGADAILLIVSALTPDRLRSLFESARSLGMAVLVETHTAGEVALANSIAAELIGVNNRDLSTFEVSLDRSLELRPLIRPGAIPVSESGIQSSGDVRALRDAGFRAVLVGESIITDMNPSDAIRRLTGS